MSQSFSMRKIPVTYNSPDNSSQDDNTDKIKILELCNTIDEWEKELLFGDKGFFSLKGKDVENKTKEFSVELKNFINSKISQISFSNISSLEMVREIKERKLNAIKQQMQLYEAQQMNLWEIEVYENSIKSCTQRAVLYKDNPAIIASCYKNGLSVLQVMAKKEEWNSKTLAKKKEDFESEFYYELISSFIKDKNVKAALFFEKYKDKISVEDKESLGKAAETLKNHIIAYNWSKELFSYDLSDSENEKELSQVKDKEVEKLIRKFLIVHKTLKKENKDLEEKEKNESNWKEIIDILNSEPDKAELYIDYTLKEESSNAKKDYIRNVRKNGYVETDKKKFLEILESLYKDIYKIKKDGISDYRKFLSYEDFKIVEDLISQSDESYNLFVSDYKYIALIMDSVPIRDADKIYDFVKFVFLAKENLEKKNKKELDIEERNKLIKSAFERFSIEQK